jgi:hypothetical protein
MVLPSLVLLAPLLGPAAQEGPLAPDGERGLGESATQDEILRPFRQPDAADEAFLVGLAELEVELGTFTALLADLYEKRGLLVVVEPRVEDRLARFHELLGALLLAPQAHLAAGKEHREPWARAFLDARLRVRARVLAGWERDAAEVRKALALLRATTDGWVNLSQAEAQLVAARADLAAALLRARVKDLAALRERGPTEVLDAEVEELLVLAAATGERSAAFPYAVEARARGMYSLLFTARLRSDAAQWLTWRDALDARAARARADVRRLRPDTEEGRDAPRELARATKTSRRRQAHARALEGLADDPFDEELAHAAARMAEFTPGMHVAVDYYDRFLAMRGIRAHDDRNWRRRQLTDEEQHALFQVQEYERGRLGGELPEPE